VTPAWLIELPECDSTNTWALAHAEALAHGACVWTRTQTAGRGRGSKRWFAPPGVLTASFVLVQPSPLAARQLSLAAGLAVAHAVEDLAPRARVAIKWPNDCIISDRKLAGILCEHAQASERVVIGVGLNLDPRWEQAPEQLPFAIEGTASVAECCAADQAVVPGMVDMLGALRRYLLEAAGLISADGFNRLLTPLRNRDYLHGKQLQVEDGAQQLSGIGAGIDGEGRLLVRDAATQHALSSGSVTILGPGEEARRFSRWFVVGDRKGRKRPS